MDFTESTLKFLASDIRSIIWRLATLILVVAILRTAWVVIYRVYFHPLAKVPGPLLARITWLYSFWYNIVTKRFYLRVRELHEQYGPVIRITPDEIHLSDPENLEKIYFVGSRYPKDAAFYGAFGADRSVFTAPSPDVHRVKRAALNPFFSRKKVLELEDIVQDKAEKLVGRMKKAFNSTGAIDLHHGFRAISVDVITDYAFGDSYNFLDRDDFGIDFFNGFRDTGPALWTFQQFPIIQRVAKKMPFWLAERLSAPLALRRSQHMSSRAQVLKVKAAVERGEKASRTTIFHELLRPDAAEGYAVPNVDELSSEAQNILGAASDTTGNTLTIAAYNVVRNPDIYARLSAEIKEAFPNPKGHLEFVALEKLPYLTAVIKEGLRLSFGVPGRLPRVVPPPGAEFNGYHVPPGTVVSMSSWIMHHNEDIYPDAERFNPDRWLDPSRAKVLERYLFSFGKGTRGCIGMPLAYCELYVTLGRMFREFDNLKTPAKSREELIVDDGFSAYHPEKNNKFVFSLA
ncbi:cytochrome P450 [Aspergillus nidulans var. acristatus]